MLPFEALGAAIKDPKSVLQEWAQGRGAAVPAYVDRFEGPDHERTFFAEVTIDSDLRAEGSGPTKKAAQLAAAARALELLGERHGDVRQTPLSAPSALPVNAQKPARKRPRFGTEQTKRATVSKRRRS